MSDTFEVFLVSVFQKCLYRLWVESIDVWCVIEARQWCLKHSPAPYLREFRQILRLFVTFAIFQQFASSAAKLIADASIPTIYEGEGICGAAFGENVKQVPKEAFVRGLIVDRCGAELLEGMGVQVGLKEKGGKVPETFFHENADGGRFFVLNFDTRGAKGRGYDISRTLADAVQRLSGGKLPAYVNGNPDLYVMVKRGGGETVVGLWNIFADSVLGGVVEIDAPAGDVEFFNCTGRKDGDRIVIDEILPFSFAGVRISQMCR